MRLDRVHARRESLAAGAAGHGVAVALVRDRLRLRVRRGVGILGREAPRQGGVVLFLAAAVASRVPVSSRRRVPESLVASSSAAAAVVDGCGRGLGHRCGLLPRRWLEQHYSAPLQAAQYWYLLGSRPLGWRNQSLAAWKRAMSPSLAAPRTSLRCTAVMLILTKAGWDPEFEIEDHAAAGVLGLPAGPSRRGRGVIASKPCCYVRHRHTELLCLQGAARVVRGRALVRARVHR